jgi:two-component system, cell cycle sensor histidine kinase and response regulator CckA
VREMADMLHIAIPPGAALRCELGEGLPPVEADGTQVRQVVMNLITNASEAIGETGGIVSIRTGAMDCDRAYLDRLALGDVPEGGYVFLEVSDTGCGMDQATRERMFEPFYTTKLAGRGLGLAAVQGIVRGHRGAIKVYSEPGRGTTVKMLLPAARGAVAADRPKPARGARRGVGKILLVDDEETVLAVAGEMLRESGFTVLTARDGHEAVEAFRRDGREVSGVVLDLTMPRKSGEETFRELRALRPDLPIVMSSGYSEQDVVQRFAGRGAAGFLQKPYQRAELVERVCEVLERQAETCDQRET